MDFSSWTAIDVFEAIGYFGAFVVIIGIIGEGSEYLIRVIKQKWFRARVKLHGSRRWLFAFAWISKLIRPRHLKVEGISFALIVIGLAIEWIGGGTAARLQSKETAILNKEASEAWVQANKLGVQMIDTSNIVAQADARAAVAQADAAQANERAAKFDKDRAMIEKEAEQIRATNSQLQITILELQGKTSQRKLADPQKQDLIAGLKNCQKGTIFILASVADFEATKYAEDMESAFNAAGFTTKRPTSWTDPHTVLTIGDTGVNIVTKNAHQPPLRAAQIAFTFSAVGIPFKVFSASDTNFDSDEVDIEIGPRF